MSLTPGTRVDVRLDRQPRSPRDVSEFRDFFRHGYVVVSRRGDQVRVRRSWSRRGEREVWVGSVRVCRCRPGSQVSPKRRKWRDMTPQQRWDAECCVPCRNGHHDVCTHATCSCRSDGHP